LKAVNAKINPCVAVQLTWGFKTHGAPSDMHSDSDNVKVMCSLKGGWNWS